MLKTVRTMIGNSQEGRWAMSVTASTTAGSRLVQMSFPVTSITGGSQIVIVAAGPDGANLLVNVVQNAGMILHL